MSLDGREAAELQRMWSRELGLVLISRRNKLSCGISMSTFIRIRDNGMPTTASRTGVGICFVMVGSSKLSTYMSRPKTPAIADARLVLPVPGGPDLDKQKKQTILRDINEYLHPHTRQWYANHGIPYRLWMVAKRLSSNGCGLGNWA
jgi:hypothetical protein